MCFIMNGLAILPKLTEISCLQDWVVRNQILRHAWAENLCNAIDRQIILFFSLVSHSLILSSIRKSLFLENLSCQLFIRTN